MEELAPTQREEETISSLTARDVGSQATLEVLPTPSEKMMMVRLDRFAPYQGTAQDEQP
jgi:hypothetical protein